MRIKAVLAAIALALAVPFAVQAASFINQNVAICDPANPANCLAPSAGGLPVAAGGATSALQTSTMATNHADLLAILNATPPQGGAMTVTAASVGVSSAQALAAGTRKYLFIQNVSATASIACRADGGTAALNTAGSFMLPPLASKVWEGSATPNAAITCIASAATTPATIESL